ncbi:2-dehydro-3-deoxyphosphooctonate aldolase [Frankliniella fusca]|uniref:2-dehydro-3-deoxyphosphooctonate aldolase n=1 Tax=Frankliniella fusca TaxID=407009 RepID=A0AAE1LDT9_9NEOP|nr:2-dehydro-3-deoxyphosphooctonate aldolase [Frankliniella fusca]
MNKKAELVVAASAPIEICKLPVTNWNICCLCQKNDNSSLVWPANNPILSKRNLGYMTLSANLEKLKGLDHALPSNRPVTSLDEGGGIHDTLKKRQAKWHKTCRDKYMPPKLDNLLVVLQRNEREGDCNNNDGQKAYGPVQKSHDRSHEPWDIKECHGRHFPMEDNFPCSFCPLPCEVLSMEIRFLGS